MCLILLCCCNRKFLMHSAVSCCLSTFLAFWAAFPRCSRPSTGLHLGCPAFHSSHVVKHQDERNGTWGVHDPLILRWLQLSGFPRSDGSKALSKHTRCSSVKTLQHLAVWLCPVHMRPPYSWTGCTERWGAGPVACTAEAQQHPTCSQLTPTSTTLCCS